MSNFVDEAAMCAKGGDGGAGCISFRREAHVSMGGPDGGDGGNGGDVSVIADRNVASLLAFHDYPHRTATSGSHGSGKKKHGASGDDLVVKVPEGTVVKEHDGTVLADLVHHGDRWLAGAGGRGGKGNARFLSNRRRAPGFAEQGEEGQERWVWMELKLMADVALVGLPNVGKSTLISRISAARPKIADYPFTTLVPNLGVVRVDDDTDFIVADVPGLIEGAAEGRGLGHQFLRHIERARVLLLLLDLAMADGTTPEEQEEVLLGELADYRPELLERPILRVGSRGDLAPDSSFDGPVISAVTGAGIDRLVGELATAVVEARSSQPEPEAYVVHRPVPEGFRVERGIDGMSFDVIGREAVRAVALSDLTQDEALAVAQERLKKMGIDRALARAGARTGDVVRIGRLEFEYEGDEQFRFDDEAIGPERVSQSASGRVVVKVGTSSITDDDGALDPFAIRKVCGEIVALRSAGHDVVLVSSATIAAGLPALGMTARRRPRDARTLQAVSAVGQARLMELYNRVLADLGDVVAGQVLLAPLDFTVRRQYLHARSTLERMLELGVLPIVNENDAVADEEIRYGDNDRIAALVAQLLGADTLVLLTDAAGLFTADPGLDESASLIEEIIEIDRDLEAAAGGSGSNRGSGGMATKVAAAKIAAWSGVRTIIAAAERADVLDDALAGVPGVGTIVQPRSHGISARKVWIAFAVGSSGRLHVDDGARRALTERNSSLLAAGVTKVEGDFYVGDAVEVLDHDGRVIAKGLTRIDAASLRSPGAEVPSLVIHRDDLVAGLPG